VDNRGSGINVMLQAMREANLEPPRFDDRRASFQVTLRNYTLMNPDAIAWLNQFAHVQLNDRQRLALVYLRQHASITNGDYRRLNRVDTMMAGQELRGLVQTGLVDQQGTNRWKSYMLRISCEHVAPGTLPTDEEKILAYVREHSSINNAEGRKLLGVDLHRASDLLKRLAAEGELSEKENVGGPTTACPDLLAIY
jgi:predicted HTH transcriptional regulator